MPFPKELNINDFKLELHACVFSADEFLVTYTKPSPPSRSIYKFPSAWRVLLYLSIRAALYVVQDIHIPLFCSSSGFDLCVFKLRSLKAQCVSLRFVLRSAALQGTRNFPLDTNVPPSPSLQAFLSLSLSLLLNVCIGIAVWQAAVFLYLFAV